MPFKDLYYHIFEQGETDAGAVTMLKQVLEKYPYFSVAQFFLLKNTPQRDVGYAQAAARTALHFNHPFYLQEQLQRRKEKADEVHEGRDKYLADEEETFLAAEEGGNHAGNNAELPAAVEPPATPLAETAAFTPVEEIAGTRENTSPGLPQEEALPAAPENLQEPEASAAATPAQMLSHADEQTKDATHAATTPELHITIPQPAEPAPKTGALLFEPLFATDYFASQGIKLSEQALPADKLGKQLKSFTEWLKTMKKVHGEKLPNNEVEDIAVQTLAERSNREAEVITEAMAEVYLRQGKRNKAKEVYEKLSLLNPAKSAYFAAKIDEIHIN